MELTLSIERDIGSLSTFLHTEVGVKLMATATLTLVSNK